MRDFDPYSWVLTRVYYYKDFSSLTPTRVQALKSVLDVLQEGAYTDIVSPYKIELCITETQRLLNRTLGDQRNVRNRS